MKTLRHILTAFAALMVAAGLFAASPASAQACLSQGDARQAVQSGQALPWSQIQAGLGIAGRVVDAQLCQGGGGLVYVVSILSDDGSVRRVMVDARSGQML